MGDKGNCSRLVCTDLFWHFLPIPAENVLLFLMQGGHLSQGNFITCFWAEVGRSEVLPTSTA